VPGGSGLVEPDIDIYGNRARASALADYLEVAALFKRRVTRAALEDLVEDNEWVERPRRQVFLPDQGEDPATWGEAVFNVLTEREERLGDKYPFTQRAHALVLTDPALDARSSAYVALLALTVVHAWQLITPVPPESTLEEVVVSVLTDMGLSCVNIGATDRGSGFVDALKSGGVALGLQPMENPTPRSRRAKDEGVDTLAGVVWRDGRPAGQWLLIGQVTVAQSHNWKLKIKEPEPNKWAAYLQEPLAPTAFLAVPHHAEEEHLRELLASRLGIMIDRLRLVAHKPGNSPNEIALIDALLSATVT
jgi:hypothetical protein